MIKMVHDVDLGAAFAVTANHVEQARVVQHPIRVERHHLAADANDPHVRDRSDVVEYLHQPAGRHDQGISPGQKHVGNLLMLRDVMETGGIIR